MPIWLGAALAAFVVGTFVEYWGHRLMHRSFKRERHIEHHRSATGQGFVRELFGYTKGTWPLLPLGFCWSVQAGVGFVVGALTYAVLAAYSHELQHAHPECCFWLAQPLHHVHHAEKQWHHNFGITVDVWDRIFGTYRAGSYRRAARVDWRKLARIDWLGGRARSEHPRSGHEASL